MNYIYRQNSCRPLTPQELADIANESCVFHPFTADDYEGDNSRIQGIHCECDGFGEFELLDLQDGETKRYMVCRNCGCHSHL